MTSVLYSGGLNYQLGNPVRSELANLRNQVADLRKLVDGFQADNSFLKNELKNMTKNVAANRTAINGLTAMVNALQTNLNAVAQQGNFTLPQSAASAPANNVGATPISSAAPIEEEDDYESEEEAPAPPPQPKNRRRRHGAE
jgi:peptidoglycan hydrolase CwlO-like protein